MTITNKAAFAIIVLIGDDCGLIFGKEFRIEPEETTEVCGQISIDRSIAQGGETFRFPCPGAMTCYGDSETEPISVKRGRGAAVPIKADDGNEHMVLIRHHEDPLPEQILHEGKKSA